LMEDQIHMNQDIIHQICREDVEKGEDLYNVVPHNLTDEFILI
jgi:hypothetical protein